MAALKPEADLTHPVVCDACGASPAAPDHAEHFSEEGLILYLWTCPHCGSRFGTELPASVTPEAEQQAVDAFWPSLLVG